MHFNSSFSAICLEKTLRRALDSVPLWYAFFCSCKLKRRLLGPLGICVQRVVNSGPTDMMEATRALFQELLGSILWQSRKKQSQQAALHSSLLGQINSWILRGWSGPCLFLGLYLKASFCQNVQYRMTTYIPSLYFIIRFLFFFFLGKKTTTKKPQHKSRQNCNSSWWLNTLCVWLDPSNI